MISVLIGCYGDYYELAVKCLSSVITEDCRKHGVKVFVGLNECSYSIATEFRRVFDRGGIDALLESRGNINKDPLMRKLIDCVDTEYFIWMDDDSYWNSNWTQCFLEMLKRLPVFDAAGILYSANRGPEYSRFLKLRPWYRDRAIGRKVYFPAGGLFIGRTAFFRTHNFPDKAMIKNSDDLLLGDCIHQNEGVVLNLRYVPEFNDFVNISTKLTRGSGESISDFKMFIDPVTGEKQ